MKQRQARLFNVLNVSVATVSVGLWAGAASARSSNSIAPNKITAGSFPEVNDLPVRKEIPEVMTMSDGAKVTTMEQWRARREEMKQILEFYAPGHAPPPPLFPHPAGMEKGMNCIDNPPNHAFRLEACAFEGKSYPNET